MKFPRKIASLKTKRVLALSAGSLMSGIHSSYVETSSSGWEVLAQSFSPYPPRLQAQINSFLDTGSSQISLADLGQLEASLSQFLVDCAKTTLAMSTARQAQPHVIVLSKLSVWRGSADLGGTNKQWSISLGDAQQLASSLDTPVLTDMARHDNYVGGRGDVGVTPGYLSIAKKAGALPVFLNIGLVSRMTIVCRESGVVLLDSDVGPGTCLINRIAAESGVPDGFDRDGVFAKTGIANDSIIAQLASQPILSTPTPRMLTPHELFGLIDPEKLGPLSGPDKVATVTALTARAIYDFFVREFKRAEKPDAVWVSGGGAYNLAILEYLNTYFGGIPVKSVEELHISPETCVPLALALTAAALVSGTLQPARNSFSPKAQAYATVVFP